MALNPALLSAKTLPSRDHAEPWELTLRNSVISRAGKAFTLVQQSGKAKLKVTHADGSRKFATLPIPWDPRHARQIEDAVAAIAAEVKKGRTLKEAVGLAVNPDGPARVDTPSSTLLLQAWDAWFATKVKEGLSDATQKGYKQTHKRLQVAAGAANTDQLLKVVVEPWKPGQRIRQQSVQRVTEMLRWATDEANGPMLDPQIWDAPAKGAAERWSGKPKKRQKTPDLTDQEILQLINGLKTAQANHPRDIAAAKRWQFAFQLMAAYGLRPNEIHHLEVRVNEDGVEQVWCSHAKVSGGGQGEAGWCWPIPVQWEQQWNLVQRLKDGESLPPVGVAGVGDQAGKYLKRQAVWEPMAERGCKPYSIRHAYSRRCHATYELPAETVASMMRHDVETHHKSYSHYYTASMTRQSIGRAIRRLMLTNSAEPV